MKYFKFFEKGMVEAHDGGWIMFSEWFYTVAKEDYWITYSHSGKRRMVKKYSMAPRYVGARYKDKFRPDHEKLWYFRSQQNAKYLINIWKRQDNETI